MKKSIFILAGLVLVTSCGDSNASNKLSKENIRENIQKVIYEAIIH